MGDAHPTGRLLWDTHSLFHMPGVTGLWVTVLGLTQMGTHLTSLCRLSDCCTRSVSLSYKNKNIKTKRSFHYGQIFHIIESNQKGYDYQAGFIIASYSLLTEEN